MWIIWIILGVVALIVAATHLHVRGNQRAFFKAVLANPEFECTKYYLARDGIRGIAIDTKHRQICVWRHGRTADIFSYQQIEKTEIIVGGNPSSGGSGKGRTLAGHAMGTALGGFGGGVVGGMIADAHRSRDRRIHGIDLKVTCRDSSNELGLVIPFLSSPAEYGDRSYEASKEQIMPWHELLSLIVEQNKPAASDPAINSTPPPRTIRFQCDRCSKWFKAPDALAGRQGKCPKCGNVVRVPTVEVPDRSTEPRTTGVCSYCQGPLGADGSSEPAAASLCAICESLNASDTEAQLCPEYTGAARRVFVLAPLAGMLLAALILTLIVSTVTRDTRGPLTDAQVRSEFESPPTVYVDSRSGYFTCDYPPAWKVREMDDSRLRRVSFISPLKDAEFRVLVSRGTAQWPMDNEALMGMFSEQARGLFPAGEGEWLGGKQRTVAGLPAYEMEYYQHRPKAQCRAIFLVAGERLHVLTLVAQEDSYYSQRSLMFERFVDSYRP